MSVENIVVGPAYPECLYSRSPSWHVDYEIVSPHERVFARRTFSEEKGAREFAKSIVS